MAEPNPSYQQKPVYPSKKCPECFVYIPLNARICPSCKIKVGKIDKHGLASRLVNWKAYLSCFAAIAAFIVYLRWAFF